MKMSPTDLILLLGAAVGQADAEMIVTSYTDMTQRYYAGDWGPAELDGGKFCEAIGRALYQLDTGTSANQLLPGKIGEMLLDAKNVQHHLALQDRQHFNKVLQTVYKFRNDRGVAHISAAYTANHLDATFVLSCATWLFGDFLRLAQRIDRAEAAAIVESIVQLEHPIIHELDGKPLVLATTLTAAEEILLLLNHSPGGTLTRSQLQIYVQSGSSNVNTAIRTLISLRQIRARNQTEVTITPEGVIRTRDEIVPKVRRHKTK